jgi:hypothetical protein
VKWSLYIEPEVRIETEMKENFTFPLFRCLFPNMIPKQTIFDCQTISSLKSKTKAILNFNKNY